MAQLTTKEILNVVAASPDLVKAPTDLQAITKLLWHARTTDLLYDANGDGNFTISDIVGWVGWALALPGDIALIVTMMYLPGVAQFLEIGPDAIGGWLSIGISGLSG